MNRRAKGFRRPRVKYRVVGVHFGGIMFERLVAAFEHSAKCNLAPHAELVLIEGIKPDKPTPETRSTYSDNTYKLHVWWDEVKRSKIPLILMDVDTIILHDLWPIFDQQFDVAITQRPHPMWFNGGVVAVRPNARSRALFAKWCEVNDFLLANEAARLKALDRHHGLNQSAFIHMIDPNLTVGKEPDDSDKPAVLQRKLHLMAAAHNAKVRNYENNGHIEGIDTTPPACDVVRVACQKWNNCDQTWKDMDDETAVVHVKGKLRACVISEAKAQQVPEQCKRPLTEFRKYDVYEEESHVARAG